MVSVLKRKFRNLAADKKFAEIFKGSVVALGARVVSTVLGLLTSVLVARLYGANMVGVLAVLSSFLTLVTIFTVIGTNTSILRLIPEHTTKYSITSAFRVYRKTQYLVAGASLVTGTLLFFASETVAAKVFSKPHLSFFFALASVFVLFKSLMDLNTQAVRGLRLIHTFAVMQVLPQAVMMILLVCALLFSHKPNDPVYARFASWTATAIAGAWIMDRAFRQRMKQNDTVRTVSFGGILSVSLPMLMTASMQFFIGQTGVVLLAMFRTESEVGYYSVAVSLATLTVFVLQAINSMAAPKFSELFHAGKVDDLFYIAKKSTKLIFWTTTPILLFLIILGKPVLTLFYGNDFVLAYPAMVFLILGQFVNSISGSTGHFLNMTGHQKIFRNIMYGAALINIVLTLILIPRYGINGAAFAGMISMFFWNIFSLQYIKSKYGKTTGYLPILS